MSEHHPDPIESNIDSHPIKLAIGIAIGAVALVIGIILMARLAIGVYGSRDVKDDPAMRAEVVAKRVAPVATVAVDPNAPASPPPAAPAPAAVPAAAPAAAKVAEGGAANGAKTYDAVCAMCHNAGVAGAPKAGDKAAWAPRLAQGKETLYASALKGKGAMPAKGGNPALADADVRAAVDHLVATAK
jgi:cytochrome c5